MLRILEATMFGVVVLAASVSNAFSGDVTEWVTRFGALGLVGFMIVQNYRQARNLGRVIGKKDDRIEELTDQMAGVISANTAANNRLARKLENRPCLVGRAEKKENP